MEVPTDQVSEEVNALRWCWSLSASTWTFANRERHDRHGPFHDDNHPSFDVNVAGNFWYCFSGCGGGSVVDFWIKLREYDFPAAVAELAGMLLSQSSIFTDVRCLSALAPLLFARILSDTAGTEADAAPGVTIAE